MVVTALLLLLPSCARALFEPNTAVWTAATGRHVVEAPLNPGNAYAAVPRESELLEARPDWRLSGEAWKLTARPRLLLTRDGTHANGATNVRTLLLARWSEGLATWNASGAWSVDYGLQNFQWGPAESASPSNRIFRDTVQVKDALYVVRGHHLVRVTFAPSAEWSEVLLLEPTSNGDAEPEANEPHSLKAALKSELAWSGGENFAGFVAGWRDRSGSWLGQYVNLALTGGLYAYVDAAEEAGSLAWYPVRDPRTGLTVYSQRRRGDTAVIPFFAGGLRYAFENGNDWRVELVHQGAGYSTEELGLAAGALEARDVSQLAVLSAQASAFRSPGLDFPSRDYLFSSVRFPNAFGVRDWNLYLRGLRSLQDHSLSTFATTENRVGDQGTAIAGLSATFGPPTGELKGAVDFACTLAYRHAW
jgi:hypothetical protein